MSPDLIQPTEYSTPAEIVERVPAAFEAAHKSGDLFFFDSTSRDVAGQFPMNVRICPALGAKRDAIFSDNPAPEQKRQRTTEDANPRPSPFRPPYVAGLYVGCLPGIDGEPDMAVILNKFAVVPEHFMIVPVEEQSQSLPPTPAQIARVYSILQAGAQAGKNLFAFYNGGPGAGASQRWRHVQFIDAKLPVDQWTKDLAFERQDRAVIHPDLPYLHIIHPLPAPSSVPYPPSEDNLVQLADSIAPAIMRSLDLAFDALRRSGGNRQQGWNLLITLRAIHLIPRSAPIYPLPNGQPLDLNALGYAGTLLTTSAEHDAALDQAAAGLPQGITSILAECAIDRKFGEQALVAEATQHGAAGGEWDSL